MVVILLALVAWFGPMGSAHSGTTVRVVETSAYAPALGHPARLSGREAVVGHATWFLGRNMRRLLLLAVLTVTLMSGACVHMQNQRNRSERLSPADTLIAYEHETWSLIKRKDLKGFASYLAEDFYDIFPDGQERTKSELLEFLNGADLKDYRLSHFRVTMLNPGRCDRHVPSRCACLHSGKRDFDEQCRDIRLGEAWWQVVERVCCRFGATSTRFKITATPTVESLKRRLKKGKRHD